MMEEKSTIKREISLKWIKADSGNTYLCPAAAYDKLKTVTEEDLKKICVEESMNPQND